MLKERKHQLQLQKRHQRRMTKSQQKVAHQPPISKQKREKEKRKRLRKLKKEDWLILKGTLISMES
jgi:hypothetical protein